ncbi:hypothetical protein ACLOJK_001872 [Asimina triloba]
MLDAESKVISCEQLLATALELKSTELEQTPQAKADILKAGEPVKDIMEPVASEKLLKVDGQNNPSSTAENITVDAVSCEDSQQNGRPASEDTEQLDSAADPVPDEQTGENTSSLDAGENISKHLSDFAFSGKLRKESDIKGMELPACKEDPHMEKDHDAETIHIKPELKEGRIQADRTEEEEIQMTAADPDIQNINMKFENVEESGAAGHKVKRCGTNDAIQSTEEEMQQEENAKGIATATEEAGRQKAEQEYEKLEQKLDIVLRERSLEPDEASFRGENIEDKKTEEKSMLASEIPTASKRYDIVNDSPEEKPAELPVVQALIKEILQEGKTEDVKLKPEEKNAQEQILIGNVDAEMIEQENLNELPPTETVVEAKDNRKFYEKVECSNEMEDAREKIEIEISAAAAEIKEAKLDKEDMNSQKAELEHKKLEQDAAIAVAEKSHQTKEQSTEAEEVQVTETKKAFSSLSEVSSVGKDNDTDIESPEEKSGELPVIQTLVKEILQNDEIEENKHEDQSQPVSVEKKAEELVVTEDEIMDAREEQILTEVQVPDNENSNEKVNHCSHKIKGENTEAKIPGDADVQGGNSLAPDASPTSQEFPSHKEDDKQANRVSVALSGESELSIANEDTVISETVNAMPAKASDLASKDQEVQRMAEVETKIGEDLVDDSSEEVFQEFSELKTGEKELESVDVSLRTEELPVMQALVEESLRQGDIEGKKPEKAAHAVYEEESAQSITMTENSAADIPEEENPPEARPLETPDIEKVEDTGNLDGKEPTIEVPDKEDTEDTENLQNQKESHSLETTDATNKIETTTVLDEEIQDRKFNVSPVEPVAEQTSSLEKQREEPNIIPETVSKEQDFTASSSWCSEIEHEKVTVSDGAARVQETNTKTQAEASSRQMRIDDSSVQKLHESSELKSEEEKMTSVPENERVEDQNPVENETGVECLEDVFLQKEAEYDKLGESEPAETEIATDNKIHFAENESPSSGESLVEQTAEAALLIGSDKNAEKKCEETAATSGTCLQIKERERETFEKTKEISTNAEMAEPCSKKDKSDVEKLDETFDETPKEVEAAGERADMGKEVLGNEEICPQEARKESKMLEHEAAGLPNISDMSANQTPNEEKQTLSMQQNSRAIEPTDKNEAEEAKTEENPHQNNDNLPNSEVEAEETMQKERSDTLDQISDVVPEEQRETIDENNNIQFDNSREDTQPDKFNESVSENHSYGISTEKGEEEAEEKLCRAVALEENKATDRTTSESSYGTVNMQDGKEIDTRDKSENCVSLEDQKQILQKEDSPHIVLEKKEEQYEQTEEPAGTVSDSLPTVVHSEETKGEILEEGMIKGVGSVTARDEHVETSFEVSDEKKLPKEAKAEPEDDVLSSNVNDNSVTTIRHEVPEEPQVAVASDNNEIEKDAEIDEDGNSLPAACERPNETIHEDEKKHQEESSRLDAEEQHCKENNKSEETKGEILEEGMIKGVGCVTARDEHVETSFEVSDEKKLPKEAKAEPEDDVLSSNVNDNSETTIRHEVPEEPQVAVASDNNEIEKDAEIDEDANSLPAACERPNEIIHEDEKKHQEETSQLDAEEQHCKENNKSDSTKEGDNEEDKDSHVLPEEREFSKAVTSKNVDIMPLKIADSPNEISDVPLVKNEYTDEPLVKEPDRIEETSGGANSEKKTVEKDTIVEASSAASVQDESLEESQSTKLEEATPDFKSEDQSFKTNDTFKVLDEEVCKAAGADESVEGQTTEEDGAVRNLDASITNVALEEKLEDEHRNHEGTPQTTVEDQKYKVKDSILVSKEQEFITTCSAEEIEMESSGGEQNRNDIVDALSFETTSTEKMLNTVPKGLGTASGEQDTQDIDKQIILEEVTSKGVDEAKSIQVVEDQSSQADDREKIPNKQVCEVADATKEDGSGKELDASSTSVDAVVNNNLPENKKLEEGQTQAEDQIFKSNDEFDLATTSQNKEVKASEVVPEEWEFDETGSAGMMGTMISVADNEVNEMTNISPVIPASTQLDKASEGLETSSKCEDIGKQMMENVDLIEGGHVLIKDELIPGSEESQKPKEVKASILVSQEQELETTGSAEEIEMETSGGEQNRNEIADALSSETTATEKMLNTVSEGLGTGSGEQETRDIEKQVTQDKVNGKGLDEVKSMQAVEDQNFRADDIAKILNKQVCEVADATEEDGSAKDLDASSRTTDIVVSNNLPEHKKLEEAKTQAEDQIFKSNDKFDLTTTSQNKEIKASKVVPGEWEFEETGPTEMIGTMISLADNEMNEMTDISPVIPTLTQLDEASEGPDTSSKCEDIHKQMMENVDLIKGNCDVLIKDELVHESEERQKPKEVIPEVEAQRHHTEDEPVHESKESHGPEEVVPEVETQRHHMENEQIYVSKEVERPEEVVPEVEAQRNHAKEELVHESEESQKPKEAMLEVEARGHPREHEPVHERRESQMPEEVLPEVETQCCYVEDEPVSGSKENQKPEEVVPDVETQTHHAEGEKAHKSEESQKPEVAALEVEDQSHHTENEPIHESKENQKLEEVVHKVETERCHMEDEPIHESKECQRPEEVVPEVEAQRHHSEDELVHESEEGQKPQEAIPGVEIQRHYVECEPVHETKESQKPEAVLEVKTKSHCIEDELVQGSEEIQKHEEVVPKVETEIHHEKVENVHISEESQKPEEVVPEDEAIPKVEAQRYNMEDKPIYGNEERQKLEENVPKVETQRYQIEDEPVHESKENKKHEDVVLEVEAERHHTENKLVHENEESPKPEETTSEVEAQRHHSEHELDHENNESQKREKVVPGVEIQRHHAEDESAHETEESQKFKGAIPQTETEMCLMEEEIVHESEERQNLEEIVPTIEAQRHHTKDELVHKFEERQNPEEVVLEVEAQSQHIDDVLGGYERIVENKDTEMVVVKEEVAIKDLNSSTINDASIEENFHEDSKEKTNLEETNDTAQNGQNKEMKSYYSTHRGSKKGYLSLIKDTETHALEEEVAVKNLNPSSAKDATVEENFNENFKELEKEKPVLKVKAAELEQELRTRESIDKLETDRTILDKDTEEIVDTSIADAAPVENLLYASSEVTVTTGGNEETEKQMIEEECTVKSLNSASLEEEPLQERESKKLNGETPDLETTTHSYKIDDLPDITDLDIKGLEATSKLENANKQTIEDDRYVRDNDTPSNQHKEADNFVEKQEKQKKPNESEGEGQQSEVNDTIHTNNNGQCEEAEASNLLPIEENIKRTASTEKKDDVTLESNNNVGQVVISSAPETFATEEGTQEREKHLEATSFMSKGQETKDCIQDVIPKEDSIAEKLEATLESVCEEQDLTKIGVSLHDENPCKTVEAFHDSPASIREFTEDKVSHIEVDECIKEVTDVSESIQSYVFKEEQNTNDTEIEQLEKTHELGSSEVIREQSIVMDDRENEMGKKDEILSTEMERNGTESEELQKPSQTLSVGLETAITSINTETQNTAKKEVCANRDTAYFEVEASKQTVSENDNKSMKVEEATAEKPEGLCHETKEANDNTVREVPIKEAYLEVEEADSSMDVEQKMEEVKDDKENKVEAATADWEPEGSICETKEVNHTIVKEDSVEEASLEVEVAGSSQGIEQKVEEEKEANTERVEEGAATADFEAEDCHTKEADNDTIERISMKQASLEVEVAESSKDIEQKAEEGKEADKDEAKEPTAELQVEGPSYKIMEANNSAVEEDSIKEACSQVEADSSSKSSKDNGLIVEEENDGEATAELEPEGPSCGTKEVNIPVKGVSIDFMTSNAMQASSEPAVAGTENDSEQKTEEGKEATKEKAEEATTELEPEGPNCEEKEVNDTTVKGVSIEEVSSELEVDGSSKDKEQMVEEEKVKEATDVLKPMDPSSEMKQEHDIKMKKNSIDEVSLEHEGDGSSKDILEEEKDGSSKDIVEQEKEADNEKVEEATTELKPTYPSPETKETNDTMVEGISMKEVASEFEIDGSIRDIEQKVEEEKETDKERVEEGKVTADLEAEGPSGQTKVANNDTIKRISIEQASLEVEVAESSKDIEQKAEERKEADIYETEEPTAHLEAQDPSYKIMEANNSSVKEDSVKEACSEVEVASSSKDNGLTVDEENDRNATAELETEGPSYGKKEVNIPTVAPPIDFMESSELAEAGTNNDIEEKIEEGKEGTKEKAKEATTKGPTCEEKEANHTTVKGVSIEVVRQKLHIPSAMQVSSELEVDGSSKDKEKVKEEKLKEAIAELKPTGPSSEMKEEHDIKMKEFSIDEVSLELEGDGSSEDMLKEETDSSSKDIVEEEKNISRKGIVEEEKGGSNKDIVEDEKVEEATTELNPTGPSSKTKEANDVMVEGIFIKEVSSAFEVAGSVKDSEQKVEEEKEAKELDVVSVREIVASFNTKCPEDATKHATPTETVKDFNSAPMAQKLQTLETKVPDDKNDVDRSIVGKEETNLKDNGILNMISDGSAAIGFSGNEILQKENATEASSSEAEENNHAKVDEKEARVPATEQAIAEEILLKEEVKMEQLKEVMNDESNDNETSKYEECQESGLDFSPVPNASETKISENEGTNPEQTSNLVSEKIQETIGTNDIKGIYIPRPEEARDFLSIEKEKDQKKTIENEWETSKVVVEEEGPEEIHPEETMETANKEISQRNIYSLSAAHKSEGQDTEVPSLGIEARTQAMVTAIDHNKDQTLAETTTPEGKEEIGNFVIINNSVSDEKIHDAVPEPKEVESSKTDESTKKSSPQTSGEEITQKEGSKKNVESTETLQANNSDTLSDLGEKIERTTQKAKENLKLGESLHVEPNLKQEKVEEGQDGTAEKRMETTSEDSIEELKELDAGKTPLSDLLERSQREKMKLGEGLVQEGHQAGKEDEVQNKQEATGQVEEEKTDEEEDDDHKKDESGSDAPVIVEAARDVDLKPTHKKSHNILSGVGSKVKNSIAKVKKAITGKSTHHKSQTPK